MPDYIDVRAIRGKLGMSQFEFAKAFGISLNTLQAWEHGQREPAGPARVLLAVIKHSPESVRGALVDARIPVRAV